MPIHTIYYVEDSEDEVYLAKRILKRTQPSLTLHHFERFDSFQTMLGEGLKLDVQGSIMVLDLNLKICSGIDCLKTLREEEQCAGMLIGICTGSEDPADRRDALESGADYFIAKPLIPTGLEKICSCIDELEWVPDSEDGLYLRRI
ncbi:response regulator [Granulosicoccus antarcticus]|uniref:response regulator n=1 Tax=Granulosicoccus antarcticus TaxID=437505 RepID=UPI001F01F63E|nr:response regulator [Granulosicoccus antarcticus]